MPRLSCWLVLGLCVGAPSLLPAQFALTGPRSRVPGRPRADSCGGDERWAVKVGADTGAAHVDLDHPVVTTLHELTLLPRPVVPADDFVRTAQERTVYVIDGFLVKFQQESGKTGDADFHLVISDSTGEFSSGAAGSQANPHSIIAEIPDPACVAGRHGTVTTPSHFAAQLSAVREQFMQHFTTIKSGWNNGGRIPVRLTGVGFFDRPHGQVGRALNGLELHPLLAIEFNPAPMVVTAPAAAGVSLTNAGFESGSAGWTETDGVISEQGDAQPKAHTGTWRAWLGGYGEAHTDRISRAVSLPADASTLTLSFFLHIETEEENQGAYDKMYVRVRADDGTLLKHLKTFSNQDAAAGYTRQSFDLTPWKGRTIRIELEAHEDARLSTSFVVDDFAITGGN